MFKATIIMIVVILTGQFVIAQDQTVQLFSRPYYKGEGIKLKQGVYRKSELKNLKYLVSAKIPEGLMIAVHPEDNFNGKGIVVRADMTNVPQFPFKVGSVRVINVVDYAVRSALNGGGGTRIRVCGDYFYIKGITSKHVEGSKVKLEGRIEHHLTWRFDDKIYYQVELNNNEITDLKLKFEAGGLSKIAGPVLGYIAKIIPGGVITGGMLGDVYETLGNHLDAGWKRASGTLISAMAIQISEEMIGTSASSQAIKRSQKPNSNVVNKIPNQRPSVWILNGKDRQEVENDPSKKLKVPPRSRNKNQQ